MRIAVFGATGRTGHPLVEQAVERGHEVVTFVRDVTGLSSTLRNDDRVSIVEGDAYTGENVDRAIAGDGDPVDAVASDSAVDALTSVCVTFDDTDPVVISKYR